MSFVKANSNTHRLLIGTIYALVEVRRVELLSHLLLIYNFIQLFVYFNL
jgi:hypothetical protein